MALMDKTLIVGSTTETVKDVIRRIRGKSSNPALTSVAAFKEAARLRNRPGLFAYADTTALAAQVDQLARIPGKVSPYEWNLFKAIVRPETIRHVTASLTLQGGNFELLARANLDAGQNNPFLAALPDKPAAIELLHFVPRDALGAVVLGLGDGATRWENILAIVDGLAPGGLAPSKAVRRIEEQLQLDIGKEVFGRIRQAGLAVSPARTPQPLGSPLLLLGTADDGAARFLEERALPKLLGLANGGEVPAPTREQVQGQRITTMAVNFLPGGVLHTGRHGAVLALGTEAKRVAEALGAGAKRSGLLGEEKMAAALKELDHPVTVGVADLGRGFVELARVLHPPAPAANIGGKQLLAPARQPDGMEKIIGDLTKALQPLPPVVVSLSRQPESLILEVRQNSLRRVSTKLLNVWVDSALDRMSRRMAGINVPAPAAPAVPVEKKAVPAGKTTEEKKASGKKTETAPKNARPRKRE
jgi:hypothetical protein